MYSDQKLQAFVSDLLQQHAASVPSVGQLAKLTTCELDWGSEQYVRQILSGTHPASSVTDLQRIYWALGRIWHRLNSQEHMQINGLAA